MDNAVTLTKAAKKAGIVITLDIGQNQRDPQIENLIGLADYVIPSLAFAKRFSGHSQVEKAASTLLGYGAGAVIQTLGEKGSFALTREGRSFTVPAFPVKAVDTTGAGDSFHGGFLFALSRGYALKQAIVFASAVAALKCTCLGGQSGLPSIEQVRQFLSDRGVEPAE
jgi:ribokinase